MNNTEIPPGSRNPLTVPLPDLVERITVKYGETVSVGDYCNVRLDVEYVAQEKIQENPDGSIMSTRFYDPHAVRDDLLARAKLTVQTEIDLALEAHGQPPKYYDGLRYKVGLSYVHNCLVIAPFEYDLLPEQFFIVSGEGVGVRYPAAHKKLQEEAKDTEFIMYDMTNPLDMGRTPPWLEKPKMAEEKRISNLIQPDKELPHISD